MHCHLSMGLNVGLIAHIQPQLIAQLVPAPVVGVVAVTHGIEVEPASVNKTAVVDALVQCEIWTVYCRYVSIVTAGTM